jgi:hypothetical protein
MTRSIRHPDLRRMVMALLVPALLAAAIPVYSSLDVHHTAHHPATSRVKADYYYWWYDPWSNDYYLVDSSTNTIVGEWVS